MNKLLKFNLILGLLFVQTGFISNIHAALSPSYECGGIFNNYHCLPGKRCYNLNGYGYINSCLTEDQHHDFLTSDEYVFDDEMCSVEHGCPPGSRCYFERGKFKCFNYDEASRYAEFLMRPADILIN